MIADEIMFIVTTRCILIFNSSSCPSQITLPVGVYITFCGPVAEIKFKGETSIGTLEMWADGETVN